MSAFGHMEIHKSGVVILKPGELRGYSESGEQATRDSPIRYCLNQMMAIFLFLLLMTIKK